jgi:GMP synthase (glutamine-hydrolysing)
VDEASPSIDLGIFDLGIPILGICYGMQLIAHLLGGRVERSTRREFGPAEMETTDSSDFLSGIPRKTRVWMSHGDRVPELPNGFVSIATSENSPIAAMKDTRGRIFGTQFHPEVVHSELGKEVLKFYFQDCNVQKVRVTAKILC